MVTRLKDIVTLIQLEMQQAIYEEVNNSSVLKFIGAETVWEGLGDTAAFEMIYWCILEAAVGLKIGDPLKEAACTVVFFFNICDYTHEETPENLRQEVKDRLQNLNDNLTVLPTNLTLYIQCFEKRAKISVLRTANIYVIPHLSTI